MPFDCGGRTGSCKGAAPAAFDRVACSFYSCRVKPIHEPRVGAMNCANCGAAMQPVGNRNYFRCPYCETFYFPEETADGVAVVGGDTQYACPVCEKHLTRAAIDGH